MAIFNGTFNGVDTPFLGANPDLPRHGCIGISTPPPRHGDWMDATGRIWDTTKVCSQEIAETTTRAPCGLSHDWEIQKKKVMMDTLW